MITEAMRALIEENTLGFVATIDPEGFPSVSPKGTMLVLDERTIAFGNIRSPQTIRNIRLNPAVEINFFDPFRRKVCRLRGRAACAAEGSEIYEALQPRFAAKWDKLVSRMRGFVVVTIEKAQIVLSPVYDDGANENDLRTQWLATYSKLHGN
jgi:uncharacterized protein